MEIEEAITYKKIAENHIRDILSRLESNTGCSVNSIDFIKTIDPRSEKENTTEIKSRVAITFIIK